MLRDDECMKMTELEYNWENGNRNHLSGISEKPMLRVKPFIVDKDGELI